MASLFGKNKLRDLAKKIDTSVVEKHLDVVRTWHHDYHNGTLKSDKETSREQKYNQDFFTGILGFEEKPANPYSFEPKATTDKGQLPDAVISYTDPSEGINNIFAAVELKGASVDLDRPQRRDGNMSPVQQGFKYKTQYRNCPFVIVSNFYEFRLYQDTLLDYEVWNLDDLVNPENDYIKFKTWFVLLNSKNFVSKKGSSKTQGFLSDIRTKQEEIGKNFYKEYKQARLSLLRDVYKNNVSIKNDIDKGIEKVQKIIDRTVFAAFAEDRGLLPDDTLLRVIKASDNSAFGGSLWNAMKGFFEAVDTGSEKLGIPQGYNGGLFRLDTELNSLIISDECLRDVVELAKYNFAEDLSVNILGHIFEQSISDLEEIKNKVYISKNLDTLSTSKRKKDGIFYTPDYIVRYIVDNSLGQHIHNRENELKEEFKLHGDIKEKTYHNREKQAYLKYYEFLQSIKVLDPACGSGAFLVYVFDYLLAENIRVGKILGLDKGLVKFDEVYKNILQKNIYGVDLNEESVEITKLSLWLKSAQKGKKLTSLDRNIKCGNSLISDPKIAGTKAFNWTDEFKDIFLNGGFDVVVGNPPYVFTREGGFENKSKDFMSNYIKESGITSESKGINIQKGKINLYAVFLSKGLSLIKSSGILSYIIPNSILRATPYEAFRKHVLDNYAIDEIVNLGAGVFDGVTVSTVILTVHGAMKNDQYETKVVKDVFNSSEKSYIKQSAFMDNTSYIFNILANNRDIELTKRLSLSFPDLGSVAKYIAPGIDGDKNKYVSSEKINNMYKPLLFGKSFGRYSIDFNDNYILYDRELLNRARKEEIFLSEKIIMQRISGGLSPINCTLDKDNYYTFNSVNNIITDTESGLSNTYLLALLNSKLLNWYYSTNFSNKSNLTVNMSKTLLQKLPIVQTDRDRQKTLEKLATDMMDFNSKIADKSSHFIKLISSEFNLVTTKSFEQSWWKNDYSEFIRKLQLSLSISQKDDLLIVYEKYKTIILRLEADVTKIDNEIDMRVYSLYGLNSDEIENVEKHFVKL